MWKTTCRTVISGVLWDMFEWNIVYTSQENRNTEIGMVCSIFQQKTYMPSFWGASMLLLRVWYACFFSKPSYEILVLEYGIDMPGDMDVLLDIAIPHIAIFTWFDIVHSESFSGVDQLLEEKMKLLLATKEVVFVPVWVDYIDSYIDEMSSDVLTFSFHDAGDSDVWFDAYEVLCENKKFPTTTYTVTQWNEDAWTVKSTLFWKEYAGYVSLGIEISMIVANRMKYDVIHDPREIYIHVHHQLPGRATLLEWICGSVIVDASYNASPKSVQNVIKKAVQLRTMCYSEYDLIYCFGDMLELGDMTQEAHRHLAARISQSADEVYLVGQAMQTYLYDELVKLWFNEQNIHKVSSSKACGSAIQHMLPTRERCSLVVIKWSQQNIYMEESIVPILKNKSDSVLLCRQSELWKRKKENYFTSLL